jgi:hypothetical protein
MNEAERQQQLLAALTDGADHAGGLRETGARAARGLEAYRVNRDAIAERALASTFATVQALVGTADFRRLVQEFWRADPPQRGDLGEWGDAFPGWLAAQVALTAWPWLGDCARLDLAVQRCERAADAPFDAASFARLDTTDPARLRIELLPGSAVLRSAWPIATIHRAHQLEGADAEPAFAAVHAAIAAQRGECALVARRGWRALVHPLTPAEADWTEDLLDGVDLAAALQRAGAHFDFTAWLATALRESWLQSVTAFEP